jgi:hypothetical protein
VVLGAPGVGQCRQAGSQTTAWRSAQCVSKANPSKPQHCKHNISATRTRISRCCGAWREAMQASRVADNLLNNMTQRAVCKSVPNPKPQQWSDIHHQHQDHLGLWCLLAPGVRRSRQAGSQTAAWRSAQCVSEGLTPSHSSGQVSTTRVTCNFGV